MTYPAAPLQKGIFDALSASGSLATAMGGSVRAYDRVPDNPTFPYLTIGTAQILDDGNTCNGNFYEAFVDIHVWSRVVGQVEAKRISEFVRSVLSAAFTVTGWEIKAAQFQGAQHLDDPDGVTAHGVLSFRYLIEPDGV